MAGHDLWKDLSENFPGTLFPCKPRADASEFTKKYLDATCLAAWLKWTLTQLPSLKRVIGGWDPVWTNGFAFRGLGSKMVWAFGATLLAIMGSRSGDSPWATGIPGKMAGWS